MALYAARWAPIVVDTPTLSFEPRPPSPHKYRPDTACDGWSTDAFQVRLASVRGYAHRYAGTSRQDAAEVRAHPATGAVAFAVADGVSSSPLSDIGAASACEHALWTILNALDRDPGRLDWAAIVDEVARRMRRDLPGDPRKHAETYGTTLVTGALVPWGETSRGTVVQVGDSAAWLLRGDRYLPLLEHKMSNDAAVVRNDVVSLPDQPAEVRPVDFELPADAVLLVGTDGFGDPLGDGTGLVGQLFAEVLREAPPPLGLAHALDFSRETFDDDRTLVVIWGRASRR